MINMELYNNKDENKEDKITKLQSYIQIILKSSMIHIHISHIFYNSNT